jgi:hypothetical protein
VRRDRGFGESPDGSGPDRGAGRGRGQPRPATVVVVLAAPALEVDPMPVPRTDPVGVLVSLQSCQARPSRDRGREEEGRDNDAGEAQHGYSRARRISQATGTSTRPPR